MTTDIDLPPAASLGQPPQAADSAASDTLPDPPGPSPAQTPDPTALEDDVDPASLPDQIINELFDSSDTAATSRPGSVLVFEDITYSVPLDLTLVERMSGTLKRAAALLAPCQAADDEEADPEPNKPGPSASSSRSSVASAPGEGDLGPGFGMALGASPSDRDYSGYVSVFGTDVDPVAVALDSGLYAAAAAAVQAAMAVADPLTVDKASTSASTPSGPAPGEAGRIYLPEGMLQGRVTRTRRKQILAGVSGIVNPGECCAILGASGSGKTSLLDVLAGNVGGRQPLPAGHPAASVDRAVRVGGRVRLDGRVVSSRKRRTMTGYVLQDDHHLKYLTVREVLTYAARLRAATSIPRDRIEARVQETINLLGLRNVADSRVGGSGIEAISVRGLSGGERRRVSIGVQLVGDPAVLFLDEPTTGLDSFTANTIVATLRALAQRHQKTIIFTVHQPRSDIFALLDKVLLMSQGRAVFFGHRAGLIDHFTRAGFPCGLYENPLDFYIDTIAVDKRSLKRMADAESRLLYLLAAYDASDSKAALEREIAVAGSSPALAPSSDLDVAYPDSKLLRPFSSFSVLLARIARNLARSPMDVLDRIYMLPFVGILMLLFMQNVGNDQISVQNRTGLLFEALSVSPVMGMMNAIAQFPEHRKLFTRSDSRDARYSGFELVSAYFLVALPLGILASLLFTAITIYPFGLQTGWVRFFTLFGTSILLYMVGELLGVVTIALLDDQTAANNTSSLLLSSSLLLGSGILRSPLTAPSWIGKGLKYAAPHFYASQLMFVSEYQDLDLTCTPRPGFEDVLQPGFCRFPSGNAYLTMLFPGAEDHELRNWLVLGAYVLLMWLLTSTVFTIVGKLKRR